MGPLRIFQIDAFTGRLFHGNPAAVVPLEAWLDDATMQAIAQENNLSETAFFVPSSDGADFAIRWFTPSREVKLCGHATLAAAHVLFEHLGFGGDLIRFDSTHSGELRVARADGKLELDFPRCDAVEIELSAELTGALGQRPAKVFRVGDDVMAVFDSKKHVHDMAPEFGALAALDARGVIVTAPGSGHDFVSRFFAPRFGIDEDPVTGSAHCGLAPYWAERLGKAEVTGHQVSHRGGELFCRVAGDRVLIAGRATTYLEGTIRAG